MLSLRRDDVTTTRTVVRITNFNPRLREGGDHPNTAPEATTENFNPRLREGGDDIYHAPSCCKKISIHASAKEATDNVPKNTMELKISIHASAKEATQRVWTMARTEYFNPRLREGGDRQIDKCRPDTYPISIHASAKEATSYHGNNRRQNRISIHASAKEATRGQTTRTHGLVRFQSTPPRRRRQKWIRKNWMP